MRVHIVALAFLVVLIAASLSPAMQIAHATSGSMEPTLPTDSVYIVNTLDHTPERGDILMYESPAKGRVTHRVVDVTEDGGYITKGDANDALDQVRDEDALRQEQVRGVVPVVLGHPAVIPGSATVVRFLGENPIGGILALWLLFGAGYLFTTDETGVMEVRSVLVPVLTVAFVASVVFFSLGVTYDVAFLATTGPHEGNPELVPANRASEQTLHLKTAPPPLFRTRVVSATGNVEIARTEEYANGTNVTVHVPALPENAVERGGVSMTYYPPVLPSWTISALHREHPLLASVVTATLCHLPVYLTYLLLTDPRKRLRPFVMRGNA